MASVTADKNDFPKAGVRRKKISLQRHGEDQVDDVVSLDMPQDIQTKPVNPPAESSKDADKRKKRAVDELQNNHFDPKKELEDVVKETDVPDPSETKKPESDDRVDFPPNVKVNHHKDTSQMIAPVKDSLRLSAQLHAAGRSNEAYQAWLVAMDLASEHAEGVETASMDAIPPVDTVVDGMLQAMGIETAATPDKQEETAVGIFAASEASADASDESAVLSFLSKLKATK